MTDIFAALEIGTTRTVMAIGELADNGRLKLTPASIPSTGVRKSQILDVSQATQSIRSVLKEIERKQDTAGSRVTIGNAMLVVSGQEVAATPATGTAIIGGKKVSDGDLEEVARRAREFPIPRGRELLDFVEQGYEIDGLHGITDPKGMTGNSLQLNTLMVHADANRIQNARNAADGAHLDISESLFATTCAADAVLEESDRKNGVLVLDLGGGSTGYAAYVDGGLATTGVIGVGGDHITNDIALAFQTTNAQAEQIKTEESSAVLREITPENARVPIIGSSALMESRTLSRHSLDIVVNARIKELFTIIRETLEGQDLLHRLHAGAVLVGGGADLDGIEAIAEQELGMHVRKGRPLGVDGLEDESSPWAFAAVTGALIYAIRSAPSKSIFDSIFKRFF